MVIRIGDFGFINGIEIRPGVAVAPPVLSSTTINDGSAQHYQVKSLALNFDETVTLAAGAVRLDLLNTGGSGANNS